MCSAMLSAMAISPPCLLLFPSPFLIPRTMRLRSRQQALHVAGEARAMRIDSYRFVVEGSHSRSNSASVDNRVDSEHRPEGRLSSGIATALRKIARGLMSTPAARIKAIFVSDMLCAATSVLVAYSFSPSYSPSTSDPADLGVKMVIAAFACSFAFAGLAAGAYDRRYQRASWQTALRLMAAALLAWGALLAINYVIYYRFVGRWIVLISTSVFVAAAFAVRALLFFSGQMNHNNILVVGSMATARLIENATDTIGGACSKIVVVLPEQLCSVLDQGLGRTPSSRELCDADDFDIVVVEDECDREVLCHALEYLKEGKPVSGFVWYFENYFQKAPVEKLDPTWLMSAHLNLMKPWGRTIKRLCDILLAILGLVLCLPMWPVIALLIKVTSPGPVFYYQSRVGIYGEPFSLIKFRSMIDKAEAESGPQWAVPYDRRITWVGRILRKTRLDETPQFLNVLKGDMALVGPRPERPEFVALLSSRIPYYSLRHLVKPGVTGWAQIMYGYGASEEDALEKLCYDLYYIKHGSFTLDLAIMIRTIGAVMRGSR